MAYVEEHAANYKFLLNDITQIITQEPDHFSMTVNSRIDNHKKEEEQRLANEREQIRLEEERKATEKANKEAAERQAAIDKEAVEKQAAIDNQVKEEPANKTLSEAAPTLAAMHSFKAKTMSVTTDDVGGFSELAAIFGEQSFGDLLYDESGNQYKLKIDVTRVAIAKPKAA